MPSDDTDNQLTDHNADAALTKDHAAAGIDQTSLGNETGSGSYMQPEAEAEAEAETTTISYQSTVTFAVDVDEDQSDFIHAGHSTRSRSTPAVKSDSASSGKSANRPSEISVDQPPLNTQTSATEALLPHDSPAHRTSAVELQDVIDFVKHTVSTAMEDIKQATPTDRQKPTLREFIFWARNIGRWIGSAGAWCIAGITLLLLGALVVSVNGDNWTAGTAESAVWTMVCWVSGTICLMIGIPKSTNSKWTLCITYLLMIGLITHQSVAFYQTGYLSDKFESIATERKALERDKAAFALQKNESERRFENEKKVLSDRYHEEVSQLNEKIDHMRNEYWHNIAPHLATSEFVNNNSVITRLDADLIDLLISEEQIEYIIVVVHADKHHLTNPTSSPGLTHEAPRQVVGLRNTPKIQTSIRFTTASNEGIEFSIFALTNEMRDHLTARTANELEFFSRHGAMLVGQGKVEAIHLAER